MSAPAPAVSGWDEALPRVVGLLRAGLPARDAWARAGVAVPDRPAGTLDRAVAGADRLAARTGAPLAAMLLAIAGAAADAREADALRRAALAGPRLSARILRWLPLAGLALGALVDPRTVRVLALTPLGWGLLAAGAGLTWAGRAWTGRLVARAGEAGGDSDAVVVAAALVAAALEAGASVPGAVRAVGEALDEPGLAALADDLGGAALGGDLGGAVPGRPPPRRAAPGLSAEPRWEPVAHAVLPAMQAGASPAASLEAAARSAARRARTDAAVAAGELGVRVTLPLALCLLPAFVAVGLLPLLVAVVGGTVGAGGWASP
ncbi:type II secretion system F family protein [Demequina rhizosphaerae]|uniref:type II secretion system F family protein n=1 Tax=Demequina rhizosphaerae TaxID=1638985 RepID=UPI000A68A8FC|nr:type II secretion system F family protein [Demequina rhizosphaerae]